MARWFASLVLTAVALTAGAAFARPTPVSWTQGARATSPDGRSDAVARAGARRAAYGSRRGMGSLWITTRGQHPWLVTRFEREGAIYWTPDSQRLIFIASDLHIDDLYLADLGRRSAPLRSLDLRLRALMRRQSPTISFENHRYRIDRISAATLQITVLQSGLPAGRDEGSFIERNRSFDVDLVTGGIRMVPLRLPVEEMQAR